MDGLISMDWRGQLVLLGVSMEDKKNWLLVGTLVCNQFTGVGQLLGFGVFGTSHHLLFDKEF